MQKVRLYSSPFAYRVVLLLCVALCVFIFQMSAEPATESADRSGGITSVIVPLLVSNFDELDEAASTDRAPKEDVKDAE